MAMVVLSVKGLLGANKHEITSKEGIMNETAKLERGTGSQSLSVIELLVGII